LATQQVKDKPLLTALAAEAIPRIADFERQSLSNIAWALASMVLQHVPLMNSIGCCAL